MDSCLFLIKESISSQPNLKVYAILIYIPEDMLQINEYPPKFNSTPAPEHGWLEDENSFWDRPFSGASC